MAVASTLAWLVSFASLHPYTSDAYFYWEGASKAATFLFIVWLVAVLRRALVRSDARFVTVLEGLTAAVFVEDGRGGVLFANPRFRAKFGEARPAMLPRDLTDEYAGELQDPTSLRWYLVRSRPLRWVDGRSVCLRLVSDITDEKRVRELVERHRDALHRSARLVALGEFASAIAHEINQPLAAIATYNDSCVRLLESGGADEAELMQAMMKCREQARRAGAIIHRLREFLRQPAPALVEHDLNAVARDALQAAQSDAEQAGVTLDLQLLNALPKVRMDPLLIEQVLLNLLRNAIEAVQDLALERRRITLATAMPDAGVVALSVSDHGPGVGEAVRERLFDAFATDKPGGLGLGLAICRSVIESHGGAISCESSATGARFAFTLPAAA
jgi:C4-dicarboxylate-specific signal transduction histidine kinase